MTSHQGYFIEDLEVGMAAEFERTVTSSDIEVFADVSGDTNPLHLDDDYAATTMFKSRIAHGMLTASFISTVLANKLPGPGTIYLSQSLRFKAPVKPGDTVVTRAMVTDLDSHRKRATLSCECSVGELIVLDGEAKVMVPSRPQ
ncbi:MAG: MaoC family dehydratase [Hyphomicrobiales bacterium]